MSKSTEIDCFVKCMILLFDPYFLCYSTIVVEPNCEATVTDKGDLMIKV